MDRLNVTNSKIAINGYDPVSFFEGTPIKGQSNITVNHDGGIYQFASDDNKATFEADPSLYLPQYGGFCAWSVSQGDTADVDPQVFVIAKNRLYLFENNDAQSNWDDSEIECIKTADANWSKSQKVAA